MDSGDMSAPDMLHRSRRGFRSYFYNYLDEIAMSVCASIPSEGPGLLYAVRRTCGEKSTCKDICTDQKRFNRYNGHVPNPSTCTSVNQHWPTTTKITQTPTSSDLLSTDITLALLEVV